MAARIITLRAAAPANLTSLLRLLATFGLLVVVAGALALGPATPAPAAAPAVSFIDHAAGLASTTVALRAAPSGGRPLATLPAGTRLGVGGRVPLRAGLATVNVLWVSANHGGATVYGFVPEGAVTIVAGSPPRLELDGVAVTALLAPGAGLLAASGGSDRPVPAAAPAPAFGVSAASAPALALDTAWLPETVRRWEPLLVEAAATHGVDPALLAVIVTVESGGNPGARSGAGAMGLMQVMPATAAGIAAERGLSGFDVTWMADPATNVDFGAYYLAQQMRRFAVPNDPDWATVVDRAAAAYNGGPGNATRWLAGGGLPAEAERYRRWVSGMWSERADERSATFEAWLAAGGARLIEAAAVVAP